MAGIKTQSLLLRTAMLLLVFKSILAANEEGRVSCMTKYLTQSGAKISDAAVYESSFGKAGLTIPKLRTTNTFYLSFAMRGNYPHAKNLQQCLAGRRGRCKSFNPCSSRGRCFLNRKTARFACKCPPGQSGTFCQKAINECASNPCLNGGRCRDGDNMFTCSCTLGYEGTRCQTKWLLKAHHKPVPAALNKLQAEFRAMQRDFKEEKSQRQRDRSGCSRPVLGYKFESVHGRRNEAGKAQLASINFQKKRQTTYVRLSYSTNIRSTGRNRANRWYFLIDGRECSVPSKIDATVYKYKYDFFHLPSYLTGICQATTGGVIGKGSHVISVHVGKEQGNALGDADSGWGSTSFLEVQEICPPF